MKMITDIVENAVDMSISDEQAPAEWDLSELNSLLLPIIPLEPIQLTENQQDIKKNELKAYAQGGGNRSCMRQARLSSKRGADP